MGNASRDVFGRVIGAVPQMVHHIAGGSFDKWQNFRGNRKVDTISSSQRLDICLVARSFFNRCKRKSHY